MHANLNTDVHENELIRNCLNDLYYRVDHLVSQNHVNPSQWSFKFVCKNYDWKYKVDIPALEAVQFIGRDRTTIIVWKLPKPGRRLDHPMPFKLGTPSYSVKLCVCDEHPDWKYKVNIPIEFAKTFLGLNGRLVHIQVPGVRKQFQVQYVTRFSQEGVFKKARFEKGWRAFVQENQLGKDDEVEFTLTVADDYRIEFQTEITRAGQ
ncbi:hypothetical protein GH714_001861 [Hevea brasiliensis]|uniref:TF-B3 domain-containing protein n=1 Tax=Hevea brasiliensis TaxID=3981 RepID=A0A6A6LUG2_HEVBR|nr:hypothetical protein GH714_001861 [Hevea brasiliensis]